MQFLLVECDFRRITCESVDLPASPKLHQPSYMIPFTFCRKYETIHRLPHVYRFFISNYFTFQHNTDEGPTYEEQLGKVPMASFTSGLNILTLK